MAKNLKGFLYRVKTPDPAVNKLPLILGLPRFADPGLGENSLAAIEPAIRSPDKAVECLVPVLNSPPIKQDLRLSIRFIITVIYGN